MESETRFWGLPAYRSLSIAELRSTISRQEKRIDNFAGQLKEQAAQIESVSTQLRLSRRAPEVVANP
jgi:hypothetical protein